MANPDPEISPPDAKAARPDAIIATGRSDYPNQVNNVLGFPFIFRGALDVRATTINDEMKIAAAEALAELARQQVPEEVAAAYGGKAHSFGPDYIIPAPFDPRLMEIVPAAVAKAAMASGVAQIQIDDMDAYRSRLKSRLNPTTSVLTLAYEAARANPKRVLFAEGDEDVVLRAAIAFRDGGYGIPVLVGRDDVHDRLRSARGRRSGELRADQQPHLRPSAGDGRPSLQAPSAARLSPARDRADGQPGPKHLRRPAARARRGRRPDHRSHPPLRPEPEADAARARPESGGDPVRPSRPGRASAHHLHRRHHRHRTAERRAARRHRRPHRPGRPAHGPRAARRLPLLFQFRRSRGQLSRADPRRREGPRRSRRGRFRI